tara:strand:- start:14957 stop:15265 length:309 start_codon:yes stop_codon:yes gene_type:complete
MAKKNVELSSGKKIKLKEMSIDDIDFCSDMTEVVYNDGEVTTVKGVSRSRTAWLRRGIAGGDFKNFSLNAKGLVGDTALKELNEAEKNELMTLIQEYQSLGE